MNGGGLKISAEFSNIGRPELGSRPTAGLMTLDHAI